MLAASRQLKAIQNIALDANATWTDSGSFKDYIEGNLSWLPIVGIT
jgi:hypothetical protein